MIPEALAAYPQFIAHNEAKQPINPVTRQPIDPHDPANWMDATTAQRTGLGVGFVFTSKDPFFFLDIDHAYDGGAWSSLAQTLCAQFAGCLIEVSMSGTGLHIIGSGTPEHPRCKNIPLGIEFYTSGRYVALTGTGATGDPRHTPPDLQAIVDTYFSGTVAQDADWTDGPVEGWSGPEDDKELLAKALRSKSAGSMFGGRASFEDLWAADEDILSGVYPHEDGYDRSSADAALCQHLAFWTGKDCERIDRLFRSSALVRDKWLDREDYRNATILHAVGHCTAVYTGGAPKEPVEPAAVMTDQTCTERMGFQYLAAGEQIKHFAGCVYIRDIHRVFTPDGALLKPEQFKAAYGGYTFALDTVNGKTTRNAWDAFTESMAVHFPKAHGMCFRPEQPPGVMIEEEGVKLVNTYIPVDIRRMQGDASPFLNHLATVLPVEHDRAILLAYMAACVQYPGVKFQWGPLLQGCEGNGKTFFITCLAEAIGHKYTHLPNAGDLGNKFNAWIQNKLFIGVEEIYVQDRREVVDTLKTLITNSRVDIQGKGADQVTGDNRANFFMCSNHKDAIIKTRSDRRYCVFYTAQQSEEDMVTSGWMTPAGMPTGYFQRLYEWLRGDGFAIVNDYLRSYQIPDELNPATQCHRAPVTSSTHEAIQVSTGRIEQEILEAVAEDRPGFCGGWISSMALNKFLEDRHDHRKVPPNKRGDLLKSIGYIPHPGLKGGRANRIIMAEHGKPRLYVKEGHISCNLTDGVAIVRKYNESQGYVVPEDASKTAGGVG